MFGTDDQIAEIELESGETCDRRANYLHLRGVIETESLPSSHDHEENPIRKVGHFTILESIAVMQGTPKEIAKLGGKSVVFFNDSEKFDFMCHSQDPVDLRSGVIRIPENLPVRNRFI